MSNAFQKLIEGKSGVVVMGAILTRGGRHGYLAIHDVDEKMFYTVEMNVTFPTGIAVKSVSRAAITYRLDKKGESMGADLLKVVLLTAAKQL